MNIIFEFEVVTENLDCQITKMLGVFEDYELAQDFYKQQCEKRDLDPERVLYKKVGEKGIFFMAENYEWLLFLNLKFIKDVLNDLNKKEKEKLELNKENENV